MIVIFDKTFLFFFLNLTSIIKIFHALLSQNLGQAMNYARHISSFLSTIRNIRGKELRISSIEKPEQFSKINYINTILMNIFSAIRNSSFTF